MSMRRLVVSSFVLVEVERLRNGVVTLTDMPR
ncbi:hypothetical protein HNQ71_004995 [Mesorhizobium sangaii]|uniref:Uncharacterized protein n=1 Tax=Mesorhizobium sangaii TaxID=505389 RepID=A0A841PVB7_9HYPH|nr:hypothetical protein [Mesorhizobium sangaii]